MQPCAPTPLDPRYVAFFDTFNRGLFFEAHEVLEALWLEQRRQPDADFYKALIQIAGAFVHVSKRRRGPALALFDLAAGYLRRYPTRHLGLDAAALCQHLARWRQQLADAPADALWPNTAPRPQLAPPH